MLGFRPVLAGNIKSLLDHYRTPETQKAFADAVFQRPKMITSFADGTKISPEMATSPTPWASASSERGMAGPRCERVEEAAGLFDVDALLDGRSSTTSSAPSRASASSCSGTASSRSTSAT